VGPAYRGFIVFQDGCYHGRVRVVAKIALDCTMRPALASEADIYTALHQANIPNIPRLVGLFEDIDNDAHVLVTTDVGESLEDESLDQKQSRVEEKIRTRTGSRASLFISKAQELHSTLSAIHKAGWLHGDMRQANLALDACDVPQILDFSQAFRLVEGEDDAKAKLEHVSLEPWSDCGSLPPSESDGGSEHGGSNVRSDVI
jgi:serine/threonine protein kinase